MSAMRYRNIDLQFKIVYTTNMHIYAVNLDWTIAVFVETIVQKIKNDYPQLTNLNLEIVNNLQNIFPAEEGEKENPDPRLTLRHAYEHKIKYLSFYVRPTMLVPYLKNNKCLPSLEIIQTMIPNVRQSSQLLTQYSPLPLHAIRSPVNNFQNLAPNNVTVGDICCICHAENLTEMQVYRISCSHFICMSCHPMCLATNNIRCPLCRTGIISRL